MSEGNNAAELEGREFIAVERGLFFSW